MKILYWIGMVMMFLGLILFLFAKEDSYSIYIKTLLFLGFILFLVGAYFQRK